MNFRGEDSNIPCPDCRSGEENPPANQTKQTKTKLWQKNTDADKAVDSYTVGRDRELDVLLAEADVLGSLAHTRMLESIGLLTAAELEIKSFNGS